MLRAYIITERSSGKKREFWCDHRKVVESIPQGWQLCPIQGAPSVCPRGEQSQADEVLHGFKRLEQKIGTSTLTRGMQMSANRIKKIWAEP